MDQRCTFSVSTDVLFRELDDEVVLLHLGEETYFGLDEVGARAWKLLSQSSTLGGVVDALLGEFDVSRDVLQKDIVELIEDLQRHKLIEVADSVPG